MNAVSLRSTRFVDKKCPESASMEVKSWLCWQSSANRSLVEIPWEQGIIREYSEYLGVWHESAAVMSRLVSDLLPNSLF